MKPSRRISCSHQRRQPPSGGCVLKQVVCPNCGHRCLQPPSGGCVLKRSLRRPTWLPRWQPPSGGCVLKLRRFGGVQVGGQAATFGWLCVETQYGWVSIASVIAATFGWLCVETVVTIGAEVSGLAATFGWLCVETTAPARAPVVPLQPPSGGCVLKQPNEGSTRFPLCSHLRVAVC